MRSSARTDAARAAAAALLLLGACTTTPPPIYPRPLLAAPPTIAAEPIGAIEELERTTVADRTKGVLRCGDEIVRFDLLERTDLPAPRPTVLLVPILAGGADLMEAVAGRMLDRGFDVMFCARVGAALRPPQRTRELDDLFCRTVLHQRIALEWLRRRPTPPSSMALLGISMGGIVSTVVAALEPRLDAVAVCLSGGDLSRMVGDSSEGRVQGWVDWRHEVDGVGDDHLQWELETGFVHEPLSFAAAVPTAAVLFVSARFDSVVPRRHQSLLWEALGRPLRVDVPLGHYSSALVIGSILDACAEHFTARAALGRERSALAALTR